MRKARELVPDIVLMDIDMPQMDGLAVTELLRKEIPSIKVLILSMHSNTEYVMRIIQSGASRLRPERRPDRGTGARH